MSGRRQVLVGAAGAASVLAADAVAQTPATPATAPREAPFAITYIEVDPAQADATRRLLTDYRDALKGKGALEYAVFEQNGRPGHFAIVERWPSAKAREDNAGSTASQALRTALAPLLIAPYDERPHFALSVGHATPPTAPAAVYVITHVDLVPTKREDGVALVLTLAEKSAGAPGNARFDALVQASRSNHLTLVEGWNDAAAQAAHGAAGPTRSFRTNLGPMSGSPYDERLYSLLK
jgi:quinol monooxygenase YgiN